jgi:nesprin-1
VLAWTDSSRASLDSLQNKKRPIREQLGLRERLMADVPLQRTKAAMAVEKLQVHFSGPSAAAWLVASEAHEAKDVEELGARIDSELERLAEDVRKQNAGLDACIIQLEQYQQASEVKLLTAISNSVIIEYST